MVRLKVNADYITLPFSVEFQFHYGTIKSIQQLQEQVDTLTFQFHYGTIKRAGQPISAGTDYISIPLWYD